MTKTLVADAAIGALSVDGCRGHPIQGIVADRFIVAALVVIASNQVADFIVLQYLICETWTASRAV